MAVDYSLFIFSVLLKLFSLMKNPMVLFLFFFLSFYFYSLKLKEASLPFQCTIKSRCF